MERYQRSEKALVAALAEAYVQGVSTRKMKKVTERLLGKEFSATTFSPCSCLLRIEMIWDALNRDFFMIESSQFYLLSNGQLSGKLTVPLSPRPAKLPPRTVNTKRKRCLVCQLIPFLYLRSALRVEM
ncbi:transposase [Fodinibius roseus]|uniref:transposase n=1 Tax=Fodinibius roseus TaxID=1194090 RepID=UPI003D9C8D33